MDNRTKVISNFLWRFFERFGAQLLNIIVMIVLARKLGPGPSGQIAVVMALINILRVFADSGMANALIQKKDPDDLDFSSVLYFNLAFSGILYLLLFLTAPLFARFYHEPEYTAILRVLGLIVVISGLYNVQQAYVSKTMQFKRFFFATLGGTVFSGTLSIAMVYLGFGIWSLVALQLSGFLVNTLILWFTVGWRPKRIFSAERLKGLFSYGWKLLAASFIDTVYTQIYSLIIGRRYPKEQLGQFDKGKNWPEQVTTSINASLDSVLLPVLAEKQDEKTAVREMTRRAIKTSSYLMMPVMAGLAACASPLVHLLLEEKWMPCVPYLQIFCAVYAFYPLHTANLNAIKAMGHSDIFLKLEILKRVVETLILLFTSRYGVFEMALGLLASDIISQLINAWPNRKLLDYPYLMQLKDMAPCILLSLFMLGCILPLTRLGLGDGLTLLIQVPLGVLIYAGGSLLFQVDSFTYLLDVIRGLRRRGKEKE
ncbi:MAG: lipopolysaccharide biosynthesis protein [Oscillospiraceae bacterium]|nr:lipopolysaccharide biosynthesis protein [Oscillospiraceae bacterium]